MSQPTVAERLAEVLARFPPRGLRALLDELERAEQGRKTVGIPATFGFSGGKPATLEILVRATVDGE